MPRHAQPTLVPCTKDVTLFERRLRHFDVRGEARDVVFGQIDEALLLTTFGTAALAFESRVSAR